jgi:hypothetical protein
MKTNPVFLLLLFVVSFQCQIIRAEEVVHKLPVLTGKVTFAEGSFFGYSQLKAGETMKLDLGAIGSVTNAIYFQKGKSSIGVIPLPGPLRIDKIERDPEGNLHLARLISGSKNSDGKDRVIMDILCNGTNGTMWIIQESEIVNSVARLDCQISK